MFFKYKTNNRLVVQNLKMADKRVFPKLFIWHSSGEIVRMNEEEAELDYKKKKAGKKRTLIGWKPMREERLRNFERVDKFFLFAQERI